MIVVSDGVVDFRAWNGSVRVIVEHGTLCDSCTNEIGRNEPALFRWWRTDRRTKASPFGVTSGAELVHAACVRPRTPAP